MSDQLAIDLSIARPAGRAIAAAGYSAVIGYVSGGLQLAGRPKDLDALYIADLQAAGLGVGLVWETSATAALGGGAQGAIDGARAVAEARSMGFPAGCPLLANLGDFAAGAGQLGAIHDYYFEFRRAPGFVWQAGGYATRYVIDGLVGQGAVGLWWQNAMDDAGVPGSIVSPNASIYQRTQHTRPLIAGCAATDYDENVYDMPTSPARPAWYYPAPTPAPAPPPPPPAPSPPPASSPTVAAVDVTLTMSDGSTKTERVWP